MYVADFCCYQARLLIELDGGIHRQQVSRDSERERELEEAGYRVLRFSNERILDDLDGALKEIVELAKEMW